MQIDWQNIDTVLLDMDGTLLDLHYDNYFWCDHLPQVWARENRVELDQANRLLAELMQQHFGTLNWYCVDFWSDALKLDVMQIKDQVSHKIRYRPEAEHFLQRCQVKSDDVRLVTNAHRKVLNLKIKHTQIDQYFNQMLCSHELEFPKEDTSFWAQLNHHTSFDPAKTLFIDDNEAVLDSAKKYGIKYLLSIAEPDSQLPRKVDSKFQMIDDFASVEF